MMREANNLFASNHAFFIIHDDEEDDEGTERILSLKTHSTKIYKENQKKEPLFLFLTLKLRNREYDSKDERDSLPNS